MLETDVSSVATSDWIGCGVGYLSTISKVKAEDWLRNAHRISLATGAEFMFVFKACQQAHSKLRNCWRNEEDGQKDKRFVEVISCTFLTNDWEFSKFVKECVGQSIDTLSNLKRPDEFVSVMQGNIEKPQDEWSTPKNKNARLQSHYQT